MLPSREAAELANCRGLILISRASEPHYLSRVDHRITEYRRRAEELRRIAERTTAQEIRDQLSDIAAQYIELAASLERQDARKR